MNHAPNHSAIELLEPRIAPALVTFAYDSATGALSIVGSDDVDLVTVLRVGANHYRLETGVGSFLPGLRTFVDLEKVTSVDIVGKGNVDRFSLIDLTELKSLTVNLGDSASDELRTSNLVVKGTVTIDDTESVVLEGFSTRIAKDLLVGNSSVLLSSERILIGGSLVRTADVAAGFIGSSDNCKFLSIAKGVQVESLAGLSSYTLEASTKLSIGKLPSGESVRISGGTGDDQLHLKGSSVKLAGGIRFDGGMGNDTLELLEGTGTVTIGKLPDAGSIQFDAGGGDDALIFATRVLKTSSGIEFFGGDGANRFLAENPTARLSIGKSASGASLHLTDGSAQSEWNLVAAEWNLKGGVQVAPGDGDSILTLTGATKTFIGKLATGQSLLYSGGAGEDLLTLGGTTTVLTGWIQAPFAAESAVMEIFGDRLRIGKSATGVSVLPSSSQSVHFTLDSAAGKIAGSVDFENPGGASNFRCSGNLSFGKDSLGRSISVASGQSENHFAFHGLSLSLAGDFHFEGSPERDIVFIGKINRLTTLGSMFYDGGEGDDDFIVEALALQVAGSIDVAGGDDDDAILVSANGRIAGDVRIDAGACEIATQFVGIRSLDGRLRGLSIQGNLDLAGAGDEDSVSIANVQVGRSFTGTFGAGNLTASFDNFTVRDTFDLNTGEGEDSVEIERRALFGNSVIGRLATIQTGGGNDSVLIGASIPPQDGLLDSTRVRFLGGLTLNGGTGTDTRNDLATQNDFPTTPPTGLDTFEQVTAF